VRISAEVVKLPAFSPLFASKATSWFSRQATTTRPSTTSGAASGREGSEPRQATLPPRSNA
jgi:hypothetical protein